MDGKTSFCNLLDKVRGEQNLLGDSSVSIDNISYESLFEIHEEHKKILQNIENNNIKEQYGNTQCDAIDHLLHDYKPSLSNYIPLLAPYFFPFMGYFKQKANQASEIKIEKMECCICFEEKEEFIKLTCKHLFCVKCIKLIANDKSITCPLCRNMQTIVFNDGSAEKEVITNIATCMINQLKCAQELCKSTPD